MRYTALILTVLLSACVSTNPATGGSMFSLMSEDEARRVGEAMARDAIKNLGLYKENPALEDYFRKLGKNLWKVTEMSDKNVQFIMIDNNELNAWATPGYINIYRGILPYFNSEAELMAVMAHEAGHLNAKHTIRDATKGTIANLAINAGAIATGIYTGNADAARLASKLGIGVANVALSAYGRDYEREADSLALRYMPKQGYDPREAYNVFNSLHQARKFDAKVYALFHNGKKPPKSTFYDILKSHPDPTERMANVAKTVGKPDGRVLLPAGVVAATPKNDPQGRAKYLKMIDNLVYGPKKDSGVAGDSVFYDTYDRLIWNLPKGMYMAWQKKYWEGFNPTDKTRLFLSSFHAKDKERKYDAEELLRLKFGSNIKDVERITVGAYTGYTAHAFTKKTGIFGNPDASGYVRIVVFPSGKAKPEDYKTKHFMVVVFVTPQTTPKATHAFDEKVRQSLNNVRFLSLKESRSIEPLRLKIYTVKQGDTLNSIAQNMAVGALKKDLLMAINGIDNNTPLVRGMLLKLVIDPNL